MKQLLALAFAGAFAVVATASFGQMSAPATSPAKAASEAKPAAKANPQQERMKECNAKAADMKGDERKKFMSSCLSGKEAAPTKMTQQQKMTACNKKAGDMKGDERKKFMSDCLKG